MTPDTTHIQSERADCIVCEHDLRAEEMFADHKVCPQCRFHYSMSARERIESLTDQGSFRETNSTIISLDPISFSSIHPYSSSLFRDQRRTGLTEAVVTGIATIAGSPVVLIVLDFGFMGGTMGCVVGEKVTLALERSAKRRLPTVAIITSGGARIQEGALSLMQMAKTAAAAQQLNETGLPLITILANPATGQAYGSFANLADIILAEPGAIVGFSSLRVIKRASDQPLPSGAHSAESHLEHGMLDAIVQRTELRNVIGSLLDMIKARYRLERVNGRSGPSMEPAKPRAWASVQMARHAARPTATDFLSRILSQFVELHGDRAYGDDTSVISGLGRIAGQTVAVIAQQRAAGESRTTPEGFRKAQRAMKLAQKFGLPVVTLVDTDGPDLSEEAEERGLGNAIAYTMALMSRLDVPTIAVVIGQAGSGGALAFALADRVLMMEHAIYTAVSPEEVAEVIYQDASRAEEAATAMRLTARDCSDMGIIDRIVPEPPNGAHADPDEAARLLEIALLDEIATLDAVSAKRRARERYAKFRNMGKYSSPVRATVARNLYSLQSSLQRLIKAGVSKVSRRARKKTVDPLSPSSLAERVLANGHHTNGHHTEE